MKKIIACILFSAIALSTLVGCTPKIDNKVVIFSSSEEFRNTALQEKLDKKFPDYQVEIQYQPTGNSAAKLKAEGLKTECDIVVGLEVTYLKQNKDILADLSAYDSSVYMDEVLSPDASYLPWERYSGCIAIREDILKEKNLPVPKSYDDLLLPEYKGLISMPSPKASGTGYMFLKSLVNARGEDKAFEYFDSLSKNILQFTSSGSGPVSALVQGEAAIGLGMTFQSVSEINKDIPITTAYFAEGAPYNVSGFAMIKGKETKPAVKEVFDYFNSELNMFDKDAFSPEQIYKVQENKIENYPKDIKYANMKSDDPIGEKDRLLEKWTH